MKRLHVVGKSADSRRLILATTSRAKSGRFEVPITPRMLALLGMGESDDRSSPDAPLHEEADLRPGDTIDAAEADARDAAPDLEPVPEVRPHPADLREQSRRSRLSAAEIQALLRSGQSVQSVAQAARLPVEWVRRLSEPIERERGVVVTQMLQARLVRSRLGESAEPVGISIVENLRHRGIRFPERVLEQGWSAVRPNGRVWRIRLTYLYRGKKRRAEWAYDAQRNEVMARNDLAADLAWRGPGGNGDRPLPPPSSSTIETGGSGRERASAGRGAVRGGASERGARVERDRNASSRAGVPAGRRTAARKTAAKAAARKTAARKAATSKTATRKTAARRAATSKTATSKTVATRTAPRKPAATKRPARKTAAGKVASGTTPRSKAAGRTAAAGKASARTTARRKPGARKTDARKPASGKTAARKSGAKRAGSARVVASKGATGRAGGRGRGPSGGGRKRA